MKKRIEINKICHFCENEYFTKNHGTSIYCSVNCRDNHNKLKKETELLKGIDGQDYLVCKWCNKPTTRIYGKHIKFEHPGKTSEDYKNEFPGSPVSCKSDKVSTSKNSGLHMKLPKYKKLAADNWKGEKNINHKNNTTLEDRQKRSPFSKTFWESRGYDNPEEKISKLINYNERKTQTQLDWWVEKCNGNIELAKDLYKDRQTTFSLEKCIKKYGEEKGLEVWKDRQDKWKKKVFNDNSYIGIGTSLISNIFINDILKLMVNKSDYLYGNTEKFIRDSLTNKAYKYDLCNIKNKKIIEFNGDYWHCNPVKYDIAYYHKIKKMKAKEIWEYDEYKYSLAKSYGYELLIVWENDYIKNPKEILKKCLYFLNV